MNVDKLRAATERADAARQVLQNIPDGKQGMKEWDDALSEFMASNEALKAVLEEEEKLSR